MDESDIRILVIVSVKNDTITTDLLSCVVQQYHHSIRQPQYSPQVSLHIPKNNSLLTDGIPTTPSLTTLNATGLIAGAHVADGLRQNARYIINTNHILQGRCHVKLPEHTLLHSHNLFKLVFLLARCRRDAWLMSPDMADASRYPSIMESTVTQDLTEEVLAVR